MLDLQQRKCTEASMCALWTGKRAKQENYVYHKCVSAQTTAALRERSSLRAAVSFSFFLFFSYGSCLSVNHSFKSSHLPICHFSSSKFFYCGKTWCRLLQTVFKSKQMSLNIYFVFQANKNAFWLNITCQANILEPEMPKAKAVALYLDPESIRTCINILLVSS